MTKDELWMQQAFQQAKQAALEEEIPVGAVAVLDGRVIGRGYNRTEALQDPTAHAEILALSAAANAIGSKHLEGVHFYVTLEPCCMCAGALVLARVERLVFGAWDSKAGACGTLYNIPTDERLNHRMEVIGGILEEPCRMILTEFFRVLRNNN